jgi:POT family proton-dependent oligopeptide transporter
MWLQIFFSANLFIDRLVDKHILGFAIPTTVFYALESIFIILLGPLFAWFWLYSKSQDKEDSPLQKFVLAIFFVGLGFLTLAISTYSSQGVSPLWIVAAYLLLTIGELLLSPIGLSAVTTLAPQKLTGMMMGIWFVALGFGGQFAGTLAKLASVPSSVKELSSQLFIYRHAFFTFTEIAFGVAVILFIVQAIVRRKAIMKT